MQTQTKPRPTGSHRLAPSGTRQRQSGLLAALRAHRATTLGRSLRRGCAELDGLTVLGGLVLLVGVLLCCLWIGH